MGIFNRSKVPSSLAVRLQGGDHTTGYGLEEQINDLNAELREARAQIAAKDAQIMLLNELATQRAAMIDELLGHFPVKQEEAV